MLGDGKPLLSLTPAQVRSHVSLLALLCDRTRIYTWQNMRGLEGEWGQTDREHPTSLRDGKGEVGNRGRAVKDWEAGELERRGRGEGDPEPRPQAQVGAHRGAV